MRFIIVKNRSRVGGRGASSFVQKDKEDRVLGDAGWPTKGDKARSSQICSLD